MDHLFQRPVTNVRQIEGVLGCTFATANRLVAEFQTLGLLVEMSGHRRNRRYPFFPYLRLFDRHPLTVDAPEGQVTQDGSANR